MSSKLYIPVNVVEQQDFIAGFGKKELVITAIAGMIAIILVLITYGISNNMVISIGAGAALLALTITAIVRDRYDESFVDKIKFVFRFNKSQKQYEYHYFNIYEGEMNAR